jgi:hypothetical protein
MDYAARLSVMQSLYGSTTLERLNVESVREPMHVSSPYYARERRTLAHLKAACPKLTFDSLSDADITRLVHTTENPFLG